MEKTPEKIPKKILVHTDGGARSNPGPAGIGVVIADGEGNVLKEIARYIGEQTNNYAEYEALIVALEETIKMFGEKLSTIQVEIMMDSELVVRQCQGIYKIKEPTLKLQFARVAKLRLESVPNVSFTHVRREKNAHADELVNKAVDEALQKK